MSKLLEGIGTYFTTTGNPVEYRVAINLADVVGIEESEKCVKLTLSSGSIILLKFPNYAEVVSRWAEVINE